MPVPPPKQPPCTRATVGTGRRLSLSTASAVARLTRDVLLRRGDAHAVDPAKVGAGLEVPAVAPEQHDAQLRAGAKLVHGREQALDHVAVVGVADLRPVERDGGDAARVDVVEDGSAGHGKVSAWRGRRCPGASLAMTLTRSSTAARRSSFGHIYAASYRCGVRAGGICSVWPVFVDGRQGQRVLSRQAARCVQAFDRGQELMQGSLGRTLVLTVFAVGTHGGVAGRHGDGPGRPLVGGLSRLRSPRIAARAGPPTRSPVAARPSTICVPTPRPLRSEVMIEALEGAIQRYQRIVANGGWPPFPARA